jgi:hypothetical protein
MVIFADSVPCLVGTNNADKCVQKDQHYCFQNVQYMYEIKTRQLAGMCICIFGELAMSLGIYLCL